MAEKMTLEQLLKTHTSPTSVAAMGYSAEEVEKYTEMYNSWLERAKKIQSFFGS